MDEFRVGDLAVPVRVVRRALISSIVVGLAVGGIAFASPKRYSAGFTMVPQVSDGGNSGLSSIASQLGVNIGTVDLTQSPLFYSELLGSKAFMLALAGSRYRVTTAAGEVDTILYEWLKAPGASTAQRHERGGILLRDRVGISSSARSGIVRFTVSLTDSALARQVAARALVQIDSFNLRTKQSQARAERQFLEGRGDSVRAQLRDAEEALVRFDERNRAPTLSPALRVERDRLVRENRVLDGVYSLMLQQVERARMEEVRNTPVVTVVEQVRSPAWPERRFIIFKTAAAGLMTVIVLLALFFGVDRGVLDGLLPSSWLARARRLLGAAVAH